MQYTQCLIQGLHEERGGEGRGGEGGGIPGYENNRGVDGGGQVVCVHSTRCIKAYMLQLVDTLDPVS